MGSETFFQQDRGKTAQEAFTAARDEAAYEYGHGGYTGTLAEKEEFTEIEVPAGETPTAFADRLVHEGDPRIDDKRGPAGCVKVEEGVWLFFGSASS